MKEKTKRKFSLSPLSIVIFVILVLYVVSLVVPLLWSLLTSVKGRLDYLNNPFGRPKKVVVLKL